MEPSRPAPAQRAADADRDAAADALRMAGADGRLTLEEMEHRLSAALAAKTHPELEALLADLQGYGALANSQTHRQAPVRQRPGLHETRRTITVMSESARRGFWRPAADSQLITFMGSAVVDLTEADLSRPHTNLKVISWMGSVEIYVPEHVSVHVSKLTLMSDNSVSTPYVPPGAGAPELHIQLVSFMSEVRVRCIRRVRRPAEFYA